MKLLFQLRRWGLNQSRIRYENRRLFRHLVSQIKSKNGSRMKC